MQSLVEGHSPPLDYIPKRWTMFLYTCRANGVMTGEPTFRKKLQQDSGNIDRKDKSSYVTTGTECKDGRHEDICDVIRSWLGSVW